MAELFRNVHLHVSGQCTNKCLHQPGDGTRNLITDAGTIAFIKELFERYAKDAAKYASNARSNAVEAVNHCIAMTARKNTHYPASYEARAAQGVLSFSMGGFFSVFYTMQRSGYTLSPAAMEYFRKQQHQQYKQREHKHKPEYSSYRREVKEAKKRRAEMIDNVVEVEVEEGGVRKKQRVEYVGGQKAVRVVRCKCKGGCSTDRCSCRKAGQKCGVACKCLNCKNKQ